jgi:iron-sulfur cluster assembly protein
MPITVSEKAAAEFTALVAQEGKPGATLRLWVAGVGCGGFRYGMGIEDKAPEQGDSIYQSSGITVFVDADSMKYLEGVRIDYVEDPESGGFSVDNPNPAPEMGCDCGSGVCGVPVGQHAEGGPAAE